MPSHLSAISAVPFARPAHQGWWQGSDVREGVDAIGEAISDLDRPVCLVETPDGGLAVAAGGEVRFGDGAVPSGARPVRAYAGPLPATLLGDPSFTLDYGLRFPYMTGAMANGIGSVDLVEAVSRAGLLGSYGAAGQSPDVIEAAVAALRSRLGRAPFCCNLIHSPSEPDLEQAVAALYLRHDVRTIEASAYLDLTPAVVRYRVSGLRENPDGTVHVPNRIVAKASRVEVASRWLGPPPPRMLAELVTRGDISASEAALAARIPMADDLTAEADSGGHTDNRPAIALIPTFLALRDRLRVEHDFACSARIGAAGGIATPASAAAAFSMGAAYIVTGTVNQACIESGSSDAVRRMLAEAEQADVAMAPAADMFEMGVKLQVLKRGTLFPMRAQRLYELYRAHDSLDALPAKERETLERTVFRAPLEEVWASTEQFFAARDQGELERARRSEKHRMALVFRWYLGLSSEWANRGEPSRQADYQIWCGPAMGAFNEWTHGSYLAQPEHRRVVTVAYNLLYGAALATRLGQLRTQGVMPGPDISRIPPRPLAEVTERLS